MKCDGKVRYPSEKAAKHEIRRQIKRGDVTAVHLRAYPCEAHRCYHIGNNSAKLGRMYGWRARRKVKAL